jgi:hypothetical protein
MGAFLIHALDCFDVCNSQRGWFTSTAWTITIAIVELVAGVTALSSCVAGLVRREGRVLVAASWGALLLACLGVVLL